MRRFPTAVLQLRLQDGCVAVPAAARVGSVSTGVGLRGGRCAGTLPRGSQARGLVVAVPLRRPAAATRWLPGVGASRSLGGLAGPTLPPAAAQAAAAADYPDGSASQKLLERCLEGAVARGSDLSVPYEPWLPVDLMQTLLIDVHSALGCSWLSAIMIACIGIRVITLPVSISAIRGGREKALIQPQFMKLTEKQQAADGDQEKMQKIAKEHQAFTQKHGRFFMLKGTWNLLCVQMPIYITAFAAMRGFAGHPDQFRSFAMEAPLWLDSLALPDPYAVLPIMTACIMMTNTELFGSIDTDTPEMSAKTTPVNAQVAGTGTFQKYRKWIMRGSAVIFIPMTWNFPAGVFVFMSTNMIAATVQNQLLRLPTLERLLELPPTPEAAQAAAANAKVGGQPALLPLGDVLPPLLTGRSDALAAGRRKRGVAAAEAEESPYRSNVARAFLRELETAGRAGSSRRSGSLEGMQVNPRYAVSRVARSAGAV
eukprot:TRINITY_DN19971_c0_g1_i1.p1 TRINITY_DN19971_c0_g1~~TRINITY_DN19971_c0_g1_i1.p1  ORF type:complete len:483 (-),score=119.16 TRINITY_DN19971_c0_g1_i1:85-1533(-)